MNSKIKSLLFSSLVLTLAHTSAVRAADDGTITVTPPVSSENSAASSSKKGDGKRLQGALEQRLDQLDQKLQLTADQKQKIKEIWATEASSVKGKDDRRSAMKAAHDQVRGILTPDQQSKFDAMGSERPARKANGKKAQ